MFALFQVVVQPVSEMGLTPNREFRSEYLHSTFTSTTPVVWDIIVVGHSSATGFTRCTVLTIREPYPLAAVHPRRSPEEAS